MILKISMIMLLLAAVMCSACVESDTTTKIYVCDTGSLLYLHSDGTYHVDSAASGAFNGNYTSIDDVMFLDVGCFGTSHRLSGNGTHFIDADGDNWILLRKVC